MKKIKEHTLKLLEETGVRRPPISWHELLYELLLQNSHHLLLCGHLLIKMLESGRTDILRFHFLRNFFKLTKSLYTLDVVLLQKFIF